jgi:hypothetical protein
MPEVFRIRFANQTYNIAHQDLSSLNQVRANGFHRRCEAIAKLYRDYVSVAHFSREANNSIGRRENFLSNEGGQINAPMSLAILSHRSYVLIYGVFRELEG